MSCLDGVYINLSLLKGFDWIKNFPITVLKINIVFSYIMLRGRKTTNSNTERWENTPILLKEYVNKVKISTLIMRFSL